MKRIDIDVMKIYIIIILQAEAAADLQSQLASLKERCAALQKENEQNEKNLEELDTQHQQAVGKTYRDLSREN